MRKYFLFIVSLCFTLLLTGCEGKKDLPDLSSLGNIMVISREEGSGTRDEFETITGTKAGGTDYIALSGNEVTDLVSNEVNAIGYTAYSAVSASESVKFIAVDGIALTEENIRKNKYPLCRNYYLAYSGELSAAESDFLSYLLSAGQSVADNECVAVKKSSSFLSDRSSGTIRINGSTSMAPLIEKMAEEYKTYNSNVTIEITATDSSAGLNLAIRGECDFAMSSRELTDYENELLTKKAVARDGIGILVNRENPIETLSIEQIVQIYNNEAEMWSDLK